MRFLILVKAEAADEPGARPQEGLSAAMAAYHQALARAGVLLDGAGLQPSAKGWRIHYDEGHCLVCEGPFAGSPAGLVAGYAVIQVRTREEALEWSRRFPAPHDAAAAVQIEARPLYERDDFAAAVAADHACGLTNRPA
ncbi:YciI family protein [Bordetella flabilis]|uniref:YCII-related domain-containing protein n=1 Tax=Bordetella flabilis TaxID=463014 RepID=A0A193GBG1_9BORD|nr:YciI family protein [Bordetella flabilis]ANN76614.1 hypothetical protein BAU07_05315 [Bordetella flabilis]